MSKVWNVLFLCTGNSARSVMAEGILNQLGQGRGDVRFQGYSAGSHPSGKVRPEALRQLQESGISTEGFRSKSWDEFAEADGPRMDFIFTVCDNAAHEVCPVWPGHPATAHWGVADPAAVEGTPEEIARAFREAFVILERRIRLLLSLPLAELERMELEQKLKEIGRS